LAAGALLDAQSLRISELSHHMDGHPEANRKHIERLLCDCDPRDSLKRLYWDDAPYQLIDPTEIERNQAYNTLYVGELSNGRRGFWILPAVTPFRGRALPFDFRTYSARTIEEHPEESRKLQHRRLIWDIYCDKPVVMDREFSYAGLLEDMVELGMEAERQACLSPCLLQGNDSGEPHRDLVQRGEGTAVGDVQS
jgi:hypothetical protein